MPSWWDYLHFNRQYSNKRNLEEGLFQIASQTCNILVKVNNTNNINLSRSDRSDEYGCAGPPKEKSSMQICVPKFRKNSTTSGCNPGLSVSDLSFVVVNRTLYLLCSLNILLLYLLIWQADTYYSKVQFLIVDSFIISFWIVLFLRN